MTISSTITTIIRTLNIELTILIKESFGSLFLSTATQITDIKNTNITAITNVEITMINPSVFMLNI
jgi:hypothetical protein